MEELERVNLGKFKIDDSYTISEIESGKYKILDIKDVVDLPRVVVDSDMEIKIRNGQVLKKFFDDEMVMIVNTSNEVLAIYKSKDKDFVKPYRMFV